MTILQEIVKHKRLVELPKRKSRASPATVQAQAVLAPPGRDFVAALKSAKGVALIAEVKRASPSRGLLRPKFNAVQLATDYLRHGAAAVSVLTDGKYFQGNLNFIPQIQRALEPERRRLNRPCPILRKDVIVDPYQVYESKVAGADALLLIAACLNDAELADLLALTRRLGMTALLEVHNRAELERVLPLQPRLIGVNNRDLRTFRVNPNTCLELRPLVPPEICFVAESGIRIRADVQRLVKADVDAVLVGEAIVRQKNVAAKVRQLSGVTPAEVGR
ncbi:MAG: indole-3-glycerol phosphate synthase TrpC [Anaerolineae bacterium]